MRGEGEGGGSSRWSEMTVNISCKEICSLGLWSYRLDSASVRRAKGLLSLDFRGRSIFTIVVVSMLFTVSLIFQKFPLVATGARVCLFVCYRLKLQLVYGPLDGDRRHHSDLGMHCDVVSFFFFHSVPRSTKGLFTGYVLKGCPLDPYISSPSLIYRRHLKVCLCELLFL